ncbi:MAG TPA: hypothetical protein VIS51_04285 [Solirubrobacterales bacterium]
MYANLVVRLADGEVLPAWQVTFTDTQVVVHLDDPFDESKYAAPQGTRMLDPPQIASIKASF